MQGTGTPLTVYLLYNVFASRRLRCLRAVPTFWTLDMGLSRRCRGRSLTQLMPLERSLTSILNQRTTAGFTIRKPNRPGMPPAPYSETPPPPQSRTPAAPPSSSLPPQSASSNGPSGQPSTVFPALHLIPLNETFVPKQISLSPPGARIKIGRQTNAKTIPNGTNGYFDSKVLSRMHAEVWSENGKVRCVCGGEHEDRDWKLTFPNVLTGPHQGCQVE